MANLVGLLTEQTQDLKASYLQQVEVWATEQIQINIARREKYHRSRKADYRTEKEYYQEQKWVYSAPGYSFGPALITKSLEMAAAHYEDSIAKLAARIIKKGLNEENITVRNGSIGVNINITITDGTKTVRAFTIVASGMIQRPHYRFLVN